MGDLVYAAYNSFWKPTNTLLISPIKPSSAFASLIVPSGAI
ncbi:MAG: hypothetical protein SPK10_07555 [Treponema sp.]|nr:hypothetical protein [Treponema sp.]